MSYPRLSATLSRAALAALLTVVASPASGDNLLDTTFHAGNFVPGAAIDNPYWPLSPGSSFAYFAESTDGCEVNLATDVNNCSACNMRCVLPNAVLACMAGACVVTGCNVGFANCNGLPADGCEVNTTNDAKNCKQCGMVCPNGGACVNSVCAMANLKSCLEIFNTGVRQNGNYTIDPDGAGPLFETPIVLPLPEALNFLTP